MSFQHLLTIAHKYLEYSLQYFEFGTSMNINAEEKWNSDFTLNKMCFICTYIYILNISTVIITLLTRYKFIIR